MRKVIQILFAAVLACACAAPNKVLTEENGMVQRPTQDGIQLHIEGEMPSLDGPTGWLNSKPLTREGLRGKVVLVDFWTYTCINWLRTEPYVRAWAEKYKDKGLVVIGVHTPEFEFEKNIDNVQRAVKDFRIDYPVAVDSNYSIWNAFNNHYWPAIYFVDAQGHIRHHQFGEGDYESSERVIQKLLAEAGFAVGTDLVSVNGEGIEAAADWKGLGSSENYVGYQRTEHFASVGGIVPDIAHSYTLPSRLTVNQWGLAGDWTIGMSAAVSKTADGRIAYRFHARDLNLVMSKSESGRPIRFRVLIDGEPPGAAHGLDVDREGNGTLDQPRLYQLIRQATPVSDKQFEILFLDPNAEVHAFTFG
jgi:thiol-disulfide isomerase/thioredoxin